MASLYDPTSLRTSTGNPDEDENAINAQAQTDQSGAPKPYTPPASASANGGANTSASTKTASSATDQTAQSPAPTFAQMQDAGQARPPAPTAYDPRTAAMGWTAQNYQSDPTHYALAWQQVQNQPMPAADDMQTVSGSQPTLTADPNMGNQGGQSLAPPPVAASAPAPYGTGSVPLVNGANGANGTAQGDATNQFRGYVGPQGGTFGGYDPSKDTGTFSQTGNTAAHQSLDTFDWAHGDPSQIASQLAFAGNGGSVTFAPVGNGGYGQLRMENGQPMFYSPTTGTIPFAQAQQQGLVGKAMVQTPFDNYTDPATVAAKAAAGIGPNNYAAPVKDATGNYTESSTGKSITPDQANAPLAVTPTGGINYGSQQNTQTAPAQTGDAGSPAPFVLPADSGKTKLQMAQDDPASPFYTGNRPAPTGGPTDIVPFTQKHVTPDGIQTIGGGNPTGGEQVTAGPDVPTSGTSTDDVLSYILNGLHGNGAGSSVQNATQQAALDLLKNPNPYNSDAVKDFYNTEAGNIDDQYNLARQANAEDMARRGLQVSTINAGKLNDLNIGQRSAKVQLASDLAHQLASSQGQYATNAINTGNSVGTTAQNNGLNWLSNLMGYGQQGFNNDMATAQFNANQQNNYLQQLLQMLTQGYGATVA